MEFIYDLLLWPALQWVALAIFIYSLFILAVMVLAIDRVQSRSESGRLRFKEDGYVMQNMYRANIKGDFVGNEYPSNAWQMYRGLWRGIFPKTMAYLIIIAYCCVIGIPLFCRECFRDLRNKKCKEVEVV